MAHTILLHILNEDAVVGEVEELPDSHAQFILLSSPRLRDGREVPYLLAETNHVIYPWGRIMSVEILPTEGEEEIVTFVRE
ncbi:MAG: hypothetical protein DRI37_02980 [Chloroflexi bacterium]|nr:MAG: hypothetical protein DRI37_02980 [Chloroflexota bacterium]